jgi:hypothetical protein
MKSYRSFVACVTILAVVANCGKKSKSSSGEETAEETAPAASATKSIVKSVEGAIVTAANKDLKLTTKLSLIPVKGGSATALSLNETQYSQDTTTVFVQEDSMDALKQVSNILCMIGSTGYADMVNKGKYVAMVDESACEEKDGKSGGGGGGQGGGGGGGGSSNSSREVKVTQFVMESLREENKPLVVNGWIDEKDEKIKFQLKIAEGSSKTNPIGIFKMTFNMGDGSTSGGYIESARPDVENQVVLKFVQKFEEGGGSEHTQVTANLDINAETGESTGGRMATASSQQFGPHSKSYAYNVSFDANLVYRKGTQDGTSAEKCLSRNEVTNSVFRYGLYDEATGSRKELNSGFPIEFNSNGTEYQGYASFWGVWAPEESGIDSVTTVNKVEWKDGNKTATPHTVVRAPGKLVKYTSQTITLGELKGVDLQMWSQEENAQYIINWDGTNFNKVRKVTWGNNGSQSVDASGVVTADQWGGFNFWVESLQAGFYIRSGEQSDSLTVKYHSQEVVSGTSSAPSEALVCFDNCIKMNLVAADFSSGSPYMLNPKEWNANNTTADNASTPLMTYAYNSDNYNIYSGGVAFSLPSISQESAGNHQWISTGSLIPQSVYDALSTSQKSKNPWELSQGISVYYRWESGINQWNKFQVLKDPANNVVSFDKPLQFLYTHAAANDDGSGSKFYGQKFMLQYGGFGELWGIPWDQNNSGHGMPQFSIKAGSKVTDSVNASYLVKPLEMAQFLKEKSAGDCSGLSTAAMPELPPIAFDKLDLGDAPDASPLPVAIIKGELQK